MTRSRLKELLKRFEKTQILVVGDLILDEFLWGTVDRISPEAPVPVVWMDRESSIPGGAANVASNIRALGGKPRLIGVVGRDEAGSRLKRELKRREIPTLDLLTDPDRPTTRKTRVIAHHQQVVRIDREKTSPVSGPLLKQLIQRFSQALPKVEGVIIEDYGKGLMTPALLRPLISLAKGKKKVITVDPKEEHFSYYRGVTALTPNKKEASLAARIPITNEKSLLKAGKKILKALNPQVLLITLGEEGMRLFSRDGARPLKISTVAKEVFDVSGAGDTVIAAFTLGLGAGASYLESAQIANAAAGVVVGKVGTAVSTPEELLNQMFQGQ